jgi:hypothetical protein
MKKPLAVEARGAAAQVLPTRLRKEGSSIHAFRLAQPRPGEPHINALLVP